jgi:hypothetical protein
VTSAGVNYNYDPARNRLTSIVGDLVESGSYGYDAVGNTLQSPVGAFTYTPFNMAELVTPTGRAGTLYHYDGDNQRVGRFGPGMAEYFIRDNAGQVLSEWQGDAWRRDYIYLGARVVAAVASATVTPPASPPSITTHPQSQSTSYHRLVTFTATANGFPAPTVQWQIFDGGQWVDIPGATSTSYTLMASRRDNGRRFHAVFTNPSGSATTNEARLTVWGAHDFDNDQATDLAVFRPNTGTWHVRYSGGSELNVPFGIYGDIPVAADYDGDGLTDIAVFRPSNATWYVRHSVTETTYAETQWGGAGDIPVQGDYDGDGRTDVAVFRPADRPPTTSKPGAGAWYILFAGGTSWTRIEWGREGDIPVVGDYDGDAKADVAVYRPTEAKWYIRNSTSGTTTLLQWGGWGDIPLAADFDGDGRTDITVFRPVDTYGGGWYFTYSTGIAATSVTWGGYGDVPVPDDYDNDDFADVAVFRPSDATWYFRYSRLGTVGSQQWGANGDFPVPAPVPSWKNPMYW